MPLRLMANLQENLRQWYCLVAATDTGTVCQAFFRNAGNRTETAKTLNINRQLVYTKLKRYGLASLEDTNNGANQDRLACPPIFRSEDKSVAEPTDCMAMWPARPGASGATSGYLGRGP